MSVVVSHGAAPVRAAAAAQAEELGLVSEPALFLALREEWDALHASCALPQQVFQSHVFLRHWAEHYLDGASALRIVTARRGGRLVMVWPLVRRRVGGVRLLRFMGTPVAQFGDVLVEPGPRQAALLAVGWERVRRLDADLFEARRLRADSVLARSGLLADWPQHNAQAAPFADLARRCGPDGPSQAYPARERSNHRRRLRRLAERGAIGFDDLGPGPAAAALAGEAVAMKRTALARHGVPAPTVADPRFSAFFRGLAGDTEGGSPLRVTSISCGGRALAIDLALDWCGTSFGHVIAADPAFERGGVGGILVYRSFAAAQARGNTRFDLLAPADGYKLAHADGMVAVGDRTVPLSAVGRLSCGLGLPHWRRWAKQGLAHLPERLRCRIAALSRGRL